MERENPMEKRESFKSRLGFLLVSAGCAIGLGNVWRFPFITGAYGGGVFVLFYLIFLVIMGIPVLTMELAVGRASRQSAVGAYKKLARPGSAWHIHGWFAVAGNYILMMLYTTVSGWMLNYFVKFLTGTFSSGTEPGAVFGAMLASTGENALYMAITVLLGFAVCSFSLQKGVERVSKIMMTGLLALILVLAVHSMTMPGAAEGLRFYLLPDWQRAREAGLGKVIAAAMNQSFFTLSIGIASMEIFGSYMSKERTLVSEASWVCVLDTFVAIVSGLIIFPACFSYGIEPDAGPSLIFITLPQVFLNMAGGRVWGTLFFLFMTFASMSTVIAVFENLITCARDNWGWSRKKAVVLNCVFILIASLPCGFGYNIWSHVHLIGGRDILDTEDFLVSNLLLPLGSLIYLLFCVSRRGWGFDKYLEEVNTGRGLKLSRGVRGFLTYVLPVLVLVIFVQGLIG